ncbi:hypothetical protein Trydic_g3503 [Trypoxylus dichotomus]
MEKKENGATPLLEDKENGLTSTNRNGTVKIIQSPSKSKNGSTSSHVQDNHEVRFDVSDESKASSKESLKDDSDLSSKPKLPDGGWGWMVVFSSLVISMIADGISFSFGLLYIEFLYEFEATKSATSWIGSLFMAVPLLTGPIMSALVDRYGCRLMTIVGGLISGLGFVLCYFAQTITVCYLTFGVIAGLGLGLCYVTAVVSIAFWFDKKRNLAIEQYGWRGCVLLLAGTFFNMCVCGCLMRDPDWMIEESRLSKSSKKSSISSTSVSGRSFAEDFPDIDELRDLLKDGKDNAYLLQTLATSINSMENAKVKNIHRSDISLPTFIKQNEKVPLEVLQQLSSNTKLYNVILENYPSLLACRSTSDNRLNKLHNISEDDPLRVPVTVSMKIKKDNPKEEEQNPKQRTKKLVHQQSLPSKGHEPVVNVERKNSLDHNTLKALQRSDSVGWLLKHLGTNTHNNFKNIRLHRNSLMYRGAMMNIHKYHLRASSCPDIYRNSMITLTQSEKEKWYTEPLNILSDLVDFSMFTELHFLFMSLSTILLFTWFIVPYFYLAKLMTTYDYTEGEASVVISTIGITNAIGMVALGWAGDQPWTSVSKTYGICLILCGICTGGITFSFTPMILADLVPLERFTIGYGLILLCQGIGNLIGPPIAGMLFDITQSWEQSFLQAALWIIISGVFILCIPFTKNVKIIGSGPLEMEKGSEVGSIA